MSPRARRAAIAALGRQGPRNYCREGARVAVAYKGPDSNFAAAAGTAKRRARREDLPANSPRARRRIPDQRGQGRLPEAPHAVSARRREGIPVSSVPSGGAHRPGVNVAWLVARQHESRGEAAATGKPYAAARCRASSAAAERPERTYCRSPLSWSSRYAAARCATADAE